MQAIRRSAVVLAAAFLFAGCQDRREPQAQSGTAQQGTGSTAEERSSQSSSAQQQAESANEQAADAQEKAAEEQGQVADAQKDVREAQQDLREAQGKAQEELNESQQAQQQARSSSQQAESENMTAQQQATAEAQRQAQETQQQAQNRVQDAQAATEKELSQRHETTASAAQQTVNGQVVRASQDELVLRQQGTDQPDLRLKVDGQTPVMIDGQQKTITELQSGMEVRASYDASGAEPKAIRIEAQQGSGSAAQPQQTESTTK
jgi:colicin import membrane protein